MCTCIEETFSHFQKDRNVTNKPYLNYHFAEGEISYLLRTGDGIIGKDEVAIYFIAIVPDYQSKGIWSTFLKFIINNHPEIKKITICAMHNYKIEYSTGKVIINDNYWHNIGGDAGWCREGKLKKGITMTPEYLQKIKQKIW